MLAATSGEEMAVVKLMDAHADVNAQDAAGNTPLMYAIDYRDVNGVATCLIIRPKST